ncbi:MAG: hypothetical protein AB1521_06630 [Bacteroidota bacterium]
MDYLGTFGTILFGALSIYFFFRSQTIKRPLFVYQTDLLQTKNHPEISIIFRKNQIHNLSRAYILFCNKGNKEIRNNDLPTSKYPTIIFQDNVKVLSVNKTAISSEENNFQIILSGNKVEIRFDYMNQNDGVVFEVLYDSDTEELPAKLNAPFIGISKISLDIYKSDYKKSETIGGLVAGSLLFGLPSIIMISNIIKQLPELPSITIIIVCPFLLALFIISTWKLLRDYFKYSLPLFAKSYFKK